MKNLVLGFAEGYGVEQLRIFVHSLQATNYDGDVAIFIDGRAPAAVESFLRHHGAEPVRLDWRRRFGQRARGLVAATRQVVGTRLSAEQFCRDCRLQHPTAARWTYYRRFMSSVSRAYRYVMLTDVRDVVFQADPFCAVPNNRISLFSEPGPRIRDSGSTAKWIQRSYGDAVLSSMNESPVLCAGAVMGTQQGMIDLIDGLTYTMSLAKSFWSLRFGLDQAALNYLVHGDLQGFRTSQDVGVFGERNGCIANLALAGSKFATRASLGQVVDASGTTIPTLHQYDRHPGLLQQATACFGTEAA